MPTLAGWLTGDQVPQEVIETVLTTMSNILGKYDGEPSRIIQPGMGLVSYTNIVPTTQRNEPAVLDWTPDRRTFVYRRPLSGLHGLYYIEDWPSAGNLLFATEIQALLAVGVPRKLHLPSLSALLRYGCIPAPWTAFKDIFVVPAGSILRWQRGKIVLNPSTDFKLQESLSSQYETAKEQIHELLIQTVSQFISPATPTTLFTSASAASMLTAVLAARHLDRVNDTPDPSTTRKFPPIRSLHHSRRSRSTALFSIAHYGYKNYQEERHIVEEFAQRYKQPLLTIEGVDHADFLAGTLAAIEAPFVDSRPLALHQLLHTAAQTNNTQSALVGLGGSTLDAIALPLSNEGFEGEQARSSIFTGLAQQMLQDNEKWRDTLYARKLIRHMQQLSHAQQQRYYLNLHVWLPDYLVHPLQQLAKKERIAIHSPYLQSESIEAFTSLPVTFQGGALKRSMLSEIAASYLPNIPLIPHSSSLLFPMRSLKDVFRRDAPEILQQTLSEEAIRTAGIFDVNEVIKLLHQDEISRELMLVCTTQLMFKAFDMSL